MSLTHHPTQLLVSSSVPSKNASSFGHSAPFSVNNAERAARLNGDGSLRINWMGKDLNFYRRVKYKTIPLYLIPAAHYESTDVNLKYFPHDKVSPDLSNRKRTRAKRRRAILDETPFNLDDTRN